MATFRCSKCNYETKTKGNLVAHISKVSKCEGAEIISDGKTVDCPICSKTFETEKYLSTHMTKCKFKRPTVEVHVSENAQLLARLEELTSVVEKLAKENSELRLRVEKLEKVSTTSTRESEVESPKLIHPDAKSCKVILDWTPFKVSESGVNEGLKTKAGRYYMSITKKGVKFLVRYTRNDDGTMVFQDVSGVEYDPNKNKSLYIYRVEERCTNTEMVQIDSDGNVFFDGRCEECIKKNKQIISWT